MQRRARAGKSARLQNHARVLARLTKALCVTALLLVCADVVCAIPLSTYHERVREAITYIDLLQRSSQVEERSTTGRREGSSEKASLEEMRRLLATNETVEWNGGVFHVDNNWLAEALDAYEKLPPADPKRKANLKSIAERLQALDERLSEIEGQPGKTIEKDEEKARLASILRREEYKNQAEEGNALTKLLKRIRDWLRSLFPEREPIAGERRENRAVNGLAQLVITALAIAVIVFVAWRFLPRFLSREMRRRKPRKRSARVVLGEQLSADETSADLLSEAERLARAGDIRGAIRKGYIALLCELHDRKLVSLAQHKTNRDYLRAVETNRPLFDEMKPMTTSFENHWYGFIPADETDWQSFRAHYRRAVTSDK